MNRPITNMENESIIKNFPIKKTPDIHGFIGPLNQIFKELMSVLKYFQKIEEERTLPNKFSETIITLILKSKIPPEKKTTGQYS